MTKFLLGLVLSCPLLLDSCTWVQRRQLLPAPAVLFDASATADMLRSAEVYDVRGRVLFLLTEAPAGRTHVWPVSQTLPDSVVQRLAVQIAALPPGTGGEAPQGVGLEVVLGDSALVRTQHITRAPPEFSNAAEVAQQVELLARYMPDFTRLRVWVEIKPNGLVRATYVERGSGNRFFDPRIMDLLGGLRFSPCMANRVPVDCWVQFPVRINDAPLASELR